MNRNDPDGQLAWRGHHFKRVEYEARRAPGGDYYMMVACELGAPETHNHYLRPDLEREQRVLSGPEPFTWQSIIDAIAARERWTRQQAEQHSDLAGR